MTLRLPPRLVRRAYARVVPRRLRLALRPWLRSVMATSPEDDASHPERLAVLPYLGGRTLEVGCGHRKTTDDVIGVDLVPRGSLGRAGNVEDQVSQADVAASGDALPFRTGTFDCLVARHNLEHYVDVVQTLLEWRRVVRPGGRVVVVVPDEEHYPGRTVELDPTHCHAFTRASLARLFDVVGELRVTEVRTAVPNWSFLVVAERVGPGH